MEIFFSENGTLNYEHFLKVQSRAGLKAERYKVKKKFNSQFLSARAIKIQFIEGCVTIRTEGRWVGGLTDYSVNKLM